MLESKTRIPTEASPPEASLSSPNNHSGQLRAAPALDPQQEKTKRLMPWAGAAAGSCPIARFVPSLVVGLPHNVCLLAPLQILRLRTPCEL